MVHAVRRNTCIVFLSRLSRLQDRQSINQSIKTHLYVANESEAHTEGWPRKNVAYRWEYAT